MKRAALSAVALLTGFAGADDADVFDVTTDGAMHLRRSGVVHEEAVGTGPDEQRDTDDAVPQIPAAALTLVDAPDAPLNFRASLMAASARYDVSPSLLSALVWRESGWHPSALSSKGAIGLAQLMPGTARSLAVDPRKPDANLSGAAHYLRQMLDLFDGNIEHALAAYNAGPARVLRAGGVPAIAETRTYVSAIIDRLAPAGPAIFTGASR